MAVFSAVAGQNYTFQIGLNSGGTAAGMGSFEIMDASTPASDDCATPQVLSGAGPFAFNTYFTTTGTAGQGGTPCTFTNGYNFDQWFQWTPTMTGTVTISTCGGTVGQPSNDTKLAAYPAGACPAVSGSALACNDDTTCPGGLSTFNSLITFSTTCGQSYLIQVARYAPTTAPIRGQFTIVEAGSSCNPGVGYCFGDETSGTLCPCSVNGGGSQPPGAPGNGCPNSVNPSGANLTASGVASLASDSVTLLGSGMPNSSALYFQGTLRFGAGGNGAAFGDGLRCAGGSVIRLKTVTNVAGASQYPQAGDPSISVKGLIGAPGTRTYQCWYRNAALFCIPTATFNLSNGFEIVWNP
jgi:hypothetical protein